MRYGDSEVVLLRQSAAGPYVALLRGVNGFGYEYRVVDTHNLTVDGPYGTVEGAYGAFLGRTEALGAPWVL